MNKRFRNVTDIVNCQTHHQELRTIEAYLVKVLSNLGVNVPHAFLIGRHDFAVVATIEITSAACPLRIKSVITYRHH